MKVTQEFFPVVLYIMLYKVVLTFSESVDKILQSYYPNESYWAAISCRYCLLRCKKQVILTLKSVDENLKSDLLKENY